jgi:hypothetical protein
MPRDRDHIGLAHVIRTKQIDVTRRRRRGRHLDAVFVWCPPAELALTTTARNIARRSRVPGEERGVGEEVRDAVRRKRLLEARCVRAFRQPDSRWVKPGEAARRAAADPQLRLDGCAIEERQVAVGGGRGEDLDVAAFREIGECADKVAAESSSVRLA